MHILPPPWKYLPLPLFSHTLGYPKENPKHYIVVEVLLRLSMAVNGNNKKNIL